MRDVLLGFLMWVLAISSFLAVIVLFQQFFGPPMADRMRSMAFVGGGGTMFIAFLLLAICGAVVYNGIASGPIR